jgi:hypothetical protein
MTASVAYDPKRLTGYRLEELAAAFDRVRDARDWKAPIQAVIPAQQRPLVEKAVLWFTDTVPEFLAHPEASDRLVVRAPGYRLGGAETRNGHLRGPADQADAGGRHAAGTGVESAPTSAARHLSLG